MSKYSQGSVSCYSVEEVSIKSLLTPKNALKDTHGTWQNPEPKVTINESIFIQTRSDEELKELLTNEEYKLRVSQILAYPHISGLKKDSFKNIDSFIKEIRKLDDKCYAKDYGETRNASGYIDTDGNLYKLQNTSTQTEDPFGHYTRRFGNRANPKVQHLMQSTHQGRMPYLVLDDITYNTIPNGGSIEDSLALGATTHLELVTNYRNHHKLYNTQILEQIVEDKKNPHFTIALSQMIDCSKDPIKVVSKYVCNDREFLSNYLNAKKIHIAKADAIGVKENQQTLDELTTRAYKSTADITHSVINHHEQMLFDIEQYLQQKKTKNRTEGIKEIINNASLSEEERALYSDQWIKEYLNKKTIEVIEKYIDNPNPRNIKFENFIIKNSGRDDVREILIKNVYKNLDNYLMDNQECTREGIKNIVASSLLLESDKAEMTSDDWIYEYGRKKFVENVVNYVDGANPNKSPEGIKRLAQNSILSPNEKKQIINNVNSIYRKCSNYKDLSVNDKIKKMLEYIKDLVVKSRTFSQRTTRDIIDDINTKRREVRSTDHNPDILSR